MSKHISRKQRWMQDNAKEYTSSQGKVVYEKGAWFGLLEYETALSVAHESGLTTWLSHRLRLGPFRRPRNAMLAVEREAAMLGNRHGEHIRFAAEIGRSERS